MAQPMTPAAVHKQYDELMTAFRRQIADPAARVAFGREADAFMRQCACGVWHADQGITPLHVEYYNAIYSKGNPVPTVLYWELAAKVEGYDLFVLPNFFRRLVQADLEQNRSQSRRFVDTFTLTLLLFAAVDGKVSEAEAGFVNACADSLSAYCSHAGVMEPKRDSGAAPRDTEKTKEIIDQMDDLQQRCSGDPKALNTIAALKALMSAMLSSSDPRNKARLDADDYVTKRTDGTPIKTGRPEDEAVSPAPDEAAKQEQAPAEQAPSLEELLAELDGLCGLDKVKADVKGLINLVKVRKLRQEAGLPVPPMSLHLVFMGNPGTGKTTVARLLAKIYHAVGVLSKGQLVEVDRSGLVAGFVGQTALKAQKVVDQALGGVLFIDEAYALAAQDNPNDFGREAIEVLLKGMEDHRDDLIVIVAGYTEQMGDFIHANPGLESRFNKYFYFEDYDGGQLAEIFRSVCKKNGYTLDEATDKAAAEAFQVMYDQRDENFGNARDVRNVFENAVARQANRVAAMESPRMEDLMALTVADLDLNEEEPSAS